MKEQLFHYRYVIIFALIAIVLVSSFVSTLAVSSSNVATLNQWTTVNSCSYLIFKDSTTTYAKNCDTGVIDYSSTDAATTFSSVFSALSNGGVIYVKGGSYAISSAISTSTKSIQIIGEGYDNTQSASVMATRLRLTSTASISLTGAASLIHNVFIDGQVATGTDVLVMSGDYSRIGSIYVLGHSGGNAVKLNGTSGNYMDNVKVDHLLIQSGGGSNSTAALYLQYVTQSEFSNVLSTAAAVTAVIIDSSDNNHFSRLHTTSMTASAGRNLVLGTSSSSASYGNTFEYVAMTPDATHDGIVVNYPLNIANGENPNVIQQYDNEGTLDVHVYNSAYGALDVHGIQKRRTDFTITTPAVPAGTAAGNAVQNTFPFTVEIFQTGGSGLHIITLSGTDTAVGNESTYLRLQPGEKVYWSSAAPSSWKWKGT